MMQTRAWTPATARMSGPLSLRTGLAATGALVVTDLLRLPEVFWAAITTLFIMQSTLAATLAVSVQRLAGTVVSAVRGGLAATYFGMNVLAFGGAVVIGGIVCGACRLDRTAYRFASITLAIIMFIPHGSSGWLIAWIRFVETPLGIVARAAHHRGVARAASRRAVRMRTDRSPVAPKPRSTAGLAITVRSEREDWCSLPGALPIPAFTSANW